MKNVNDIKIIENKTYIFQGNTTISSTEFFKFKILEVTEKTYFIENVDTGSKFRMGIENFNYNYKAVEIIKNKEINLYV